MMIASRMLTLRDDSSDIDTNPDIRTREDTGRLLGLSL
jgi:hypothetical protein